MAKNEYGGYLSFEQGEREYYADTSEYNTYRLNAARYAMVTVVKQKQILQMPCLLVFRQIFLQI